MIRLPDGRLIIIDVGPPDSPLLEWLRQRPSEKIYAVVLTHNDQDHAGAFDSLLKECHARIEHQFVLMDRSDKAEVTQRIIGAALQYDPGVTLHRLEATPAAPQAIYGCEADLPILVYAVHPGTAESMANQIKSSPSPNTVSAIVCLKVGDKVFAIWPGDAAMKTITKACAALAPQVVMGPHHGAPVDRKAKHYLGAFDSPNPETVVVSVGTRNRYDHPVSNFIEQHARRGRRACCTQLQHCDRQRVQQGRHVLNNHALLGLPPPPSPSAVTCRGPIVMTWAPAQQNFTFDRFHAAHQESIRHLHSPRCLPR